VDINRKRAIFFQAGLALSLAALVGAFSVTFAEPKDFTAFLPEQVIVETELVEITQERPPEQITQPVRATVAVITDLLEIVKNDAIIEQDFTFVEFDREIMNLGTVTVEGEDIEEDEIFVTAEQMPLFMGGGLEAFRNWVQRGLVYPEQARTSGIQGRVYVQFVIERDGTLAGIEITRSPDRSLSDEVIRMLRTSPRWEPGRQRGNPVRIRFTMPVDFQITAF
jgi:protein TonB